MASNSYSILSRTIYATIAMKNEQQPTYIGQVVTLVTHVGSNYCSICLMSGPPKEKLYVSRSKENVRFYASFYWICFE